MKKTAILLVLTAILGSILQGRAQSSTELNDYKYVVIPMQFSFQSEENQDLLSSRVKHLFDQHNFNTVMATEEFPSDLAFNQCLGLHVNLESQSEGFFSMVTELKVTLTNCRNQLVFESKVGESRTKDVKQAYKEALRDAFLSFNDIHYAYNGNKGSSSAQESEADVAKNENNPLAATLDKVYERGGKSFVVNKIEAGYIVKTAKTDERVALMNLTENNSILYNSDKINGTAQVEADGTIKVEYYDTTVGKLKKLIYKQKAGE